MKTSELQNCHQMATFGAKFLRTINKSNTHDCKRYLSPLILKVTDCYTREIKKCFHSRFIKILTKRAYLGTFVSSQKHSTWILKKI